MQTTYSAAELANNEKALIQADSLSNTISHSSDEEAPPFHDPQLTTDRPKKPVTTQFENLSSTICKLFDLGVEKRGVERIPENQRSDQHFWNNLFMWWSANSSITALSVGILARQAFELPLLNAIAVILCFGVIGTCMTASVAILGPKTGLRTMIIARFSSGYIGGTIFSLLNIITTLGFATSCTILGGQTLAQVNPGTLPLPAGISIIAILSLIPCFIGYEAIQRFEKYAWIVLAAVLSCLLGLGAQAGFDVHMEMTNEDRKQNLEADILGFGGVVFASFTGWSTVIADYNCRMPANTAPMKIFGMTFIGIYIPVCLVEILGAALMSIGSTAYLDALNARGFGGLLAQVVSPWKVGGKILLLILALSVLVNNIMNTYSVGLSIQSLGRPFSTLPRFFWTVIACAIYTAMGIAGRNHFAQFLANFFSILGYWTALFIVIIMEEHFLFRRTDGRLGGYNLDDWDTPSRLPLGFAGVLAACFGAGGAVVGMSKAWYTGPIARLSGGDSRHGADLGFELAAMFAGVTFPVFRWLEICLTRRIHYASQSGNRP